MFLYKCAAVASRVRRYWRLTCETACKLWQIQWNEFRSKLEVNQAVTLLRSCHIELVFYGLLFCSVSFSPLCYLVFISLFLHLIWFCSLPTLCSRSIFFLFETLSGWHLGPNLNFRTDTFYNFIWNSFFKQITLAKRYMNSFTEDAMTSEYFKMHTQYSVKYDVLRWCDTMEGLFARCSPRGVIWRVVTVLQTVTNSLYVCGDTLHSLSLILTIRAGCDPGAASRLAVINWERRIQWDGLKAF